MTKKNKMFKQNRKKKKKYMKSLPT